MLQKNQRNQFKKLLTTSLTFVVFGLAVTSVHATPERDAMEDYWIDQYIQHSPLLFSFIDNEQFHWVADEGETPAEAKQRQVCTDLANTNIVQNTNTVSSDPFGAGIIYYNSYEYDMQYSSGGICIDRDDYTTDDRIGHEEIMEVAPFGTPLEQEPNYFISYWYQSSDPEITPLLDNPGPVDDSGYLLGKAEVDQCVNFLSYNISTQQWEYYPNTIAELLEPGEVCDTYVDNADPDTSPANNPPIPKTNQAYVWSMFVDNEFDRLWFGTVANTSCLVAASTFTTEPFLSYGEFGCEFGSSPYGQAQDPPLEAAAGDWRPPHIYYYNTAGAPPPDVDPPVDVTPEDPLINNTMGIRAAGVVDGVAILGGPSLEAIGGGSLSAGLDGEVNLFAFNSATGDFIESYAYDTYNDIRKWVQVNGVLYTSMKSTVDGSGHILRWRGTLADPLGPDAFEVVGIIPNGMGAYLAEHDGRIFLTTWPALELEQGGGGLPNEDSRAALFMSPVVPAGGLTAAHVDQWTSVWDVGMYEKDYITSFTYGGGALASLNGYLYWGTIHVLNIANLAATAAHGTAGINLDTDGSGSIDGDEDNVIQMGTFRPLSLFRGRNFGQADQEVELLYGMDYMPVYCTSLLDCADGSATEVPNCFLDPTDNCPNYPSYTVGEDAYHRNNMNQDPLWGPAGGWASTNVYTWSMEVYKNRLYIGTFDSADVGGNSIGLRQEAGDLYRVDCDHSVAKIENLSGLNNDENYGFRNMVTDGEYLYVGTANPQNLNEDGGWELIRLGENGEAGICGYDCEPMDGIVLKFDQVATSGGCDAVVAAGSEPPENYNFLGQTYEINATGFSGSLEICFEYNEGDLTVEESRVAVMHRDDVNSPWEDITSSRDTQANIICGRTNTLSEFSAGEDLRPRAAGGGSGGGCFISSAAGTFFGF